MDTHYVNEVLKGNTDAFGYFIQTYQNKAFGVAISIVKDEDDAKDVVQDSFITAYGALSGFRHDAKFSTWLYRIVVNTALQWLKRQKRKEVVTYEYTLVHENQVSWNGALAQLEKQELRSLIRTIFQHLPPKEALILQLYYIDDYGLAELVGITGFSRANIKVLLHRGRANFYAMLDHNNIKKPYENG